MWNLTLPWWEFVLRGVMVYLLLLLLLRATGKRQIGQLAPFDLVLLLVLSNAVQNAMNGGDNSVTAGAILAVTLVGLNGLVGWVVWKNKRAEAWVEGRPQLIVHHGVVYQDVMEKARLTHHELETALRAAGCAAIADVEFAVLENNGQITVRAKSSSAFA